MRSTPRKTGRQAKPAKASLMNTVYLKRCEEYDRAAILGIVREGMKALAYVPSGNVFVKPNCVFASTGGKFGTNAHTNPDFLGATALALGNADNVKRVDVGENTGMRIPTRMFYKQAGYYKLMDDIQKQSRAKVDLFCIDEERRDRVFVGGVVHNTVRLSRRMARADSKVYVPKLKCHNVVNVTGAVKLNIGVLSDDERAIRHDFMLIDKIVDLLKAGYPDFIVMDAIDVGVANEIIPTVRKLGLVIMGRNPMAVDIVASRLLGYEIGDVPYLKRAVERGYTPGSLKEITLAGDITSIRELDAQAKRIQPYDEEYYRWQDIPGSSRG